MAQIELRITASDADDYRSTLQQLLAGANPGPLPAPNAAERSGISGSAIDASTASLAGTRTPTASSAPQGDGSPTRRGRPRKDPPAADPFGEQIKQVVAEAAAEEAAAAAADLNPFAEPGETQTPAPTAEPEAKALTEADVRAAMSKFLATPGNSALKMKDLVAKTVGKAIGGIPDIPAADYAKVIEALGA